MLASVSRGSTCSALQSCSSRSLLVRKTTSPGNCPASKAGADSAAVTRLSWTAVVMAIRVKLVMVVERMNVGGPFWVRCRSLDAIRNTAGILGDR